MISADRLNAWLGGLRGEDAGRAILAIGVDPADVGRARADIAIGQPLPLIPWKLDDEVFTHRTAVDARQFAVAPPLAAGLRLSVETTAPAAEIISHLLRVPEVASAFAGVQRPAGSLRRRPWRWPLRVTLVGFPAAAADELAASLEANQPVLAPLVQLSRLEEEPGAAGIAMLAEPLADAVARLLQLRPVANAVVVLADANEGAALIEAELATARVATGAVASALVSPRELSEFVPALVAPLSHAGPLDVALTYAGMREVLLWAEPEGVEGRAALRQIARHEAEELERIGMAIGAERPVTQLRDDLVFAADGGFRHETNEATEIATMSADAEAALEDADKERWCQAHVGDDNVVRSGPNEVRVFIGPLEADALAAPQPFDDSALPWEEEDVEAFRLTVVFIGPQDEHEAQRRELDLPRVGRSGDVAFELLADDGVEEVAARIVVLFRNRILQTAVLTGRVGEEAQLTEVVALTQSLAALDDRRPFDVAILANHTGRRSTLTRHSSSGTHISSAGGIPDIAESIANQLALIADIRPLPKDGLRSEKVRAQLVELALLGCELRKDLYHELGGLRGASRIQIVSARSDWLLPLELAYEHEAPDPDAQICDRYIADPQTCNGACTGENDTSRLCPNAFWGLSKTIERHNWDPDEDPELQNGQLLVGAKQPRRGRGEVMVDHALFGASTKVTAKEAATTVEAVGHGATAVEGWDDWVAALKAQDTQLLVLLPHADYAQRTLEIRKTKLARGRIAQRHVTGEREVDPLVVLFGCRTTGTRGSPVGFAALFAHARASVVFHSSTDLLNSHATHLARRLVAKLASDGQRRRMVSDALTEFRREAVKEGVVLAFAISAFGDADWRI